MDKQMQITNLFDWMTKNITYGWLGKDKKIYVGDKYFDTHFWSQYQLMLPQEVFTHKLGVCWDQVMFSNWVFETLDIEYKLIFIQQFKISTHTFLIYKEGNKWTYFETSFEKFRGIHSGFKNPEEIIKQVYTNMCSIPSNKPQTGYIYSYMDPVDFKTKLSCAEFYKKVNYNWDEAE